MELWQDRENSKKWRKKSSHLNFLIFCTISASFALCLFFYGFFPMKIVDRKFSTKEEIPTKILNLSVDNQVLYQRHVGRLVFVLIDAFRWDFVEVPEHMPYISKLQELKQAIVLTARCHPPTATMPRVKALMTGTVPNYIDVILNLGSNEVLEDNLIDQAMKNDLKVVFYGDEMWLNLFPHKFMRHEGTASFHVFDYTEVDHNVTRNIASEMKNDDWDILILHYLGLDHIGHFAGPNSPLIPEKLIEMDAIIRTLHENLQKWDWEHPEEPPSYLVVVGDHGMHASGSHGGATLPEVLASLVLIENSPHNISLSDGRPEVAQIDLASTLSVLLGLPLPHMGLGVLIPHALQRLTTQQYLFSLFYNTQLISNQFLLADADGRSRECFAQYLEAQSVHLSWLESGSEDLRHVTEKLYLNAAQEMSTFLVQKLVTFDESALVMSCIILVQVPLCLFLVWAAKVDDHAQKVEIRVFTTFITGLIILFIFGVYDFFFSTKAKYFCILSFSIFIIALQCWTLFKVPYSLQSFTFWKLPFLSVFLCVGCVLHTISFCSSSLIEEEHQTWYFLWTTLMLLTFLKKSNAGSKLHLIGILLGHRFLRKLNQTGDKWASTPDLADWLEMPQHHLYLLFVFLLGLFGVWISLVSLKCISNAVDKILLCLSLSCVLLYRRAVGDISFAYIPAISRGMRVVQLFWFTLGLIFLRSLIKLKKKTSLKGVVRVLILIFMLTSTLLLRPCNVVLISFVVLASSFILSRFGQSVVDCTISHVWLGIVVYFYQGNSNNLATVDVAVGYIGTDQQSITSAGVLVFIYTFSFPILATLLLWLKIASEPQMLQRKQDLLNSLTVCLLQRFLPMSIYCILLTFQQEHLFIWSVFAPKLLYETLHTVFCFITVALGCVLLLCFDT